MKSSKIHSSGQGIASATVQNDMEDFDMIQLQSQLIHSLIGDFMCVEQRGF